MNLGVVTVNLPRIALEAAGDKEKFWGLFHDRMAIAKDALVYRVNRVKEATPANAPILTSMGPLASVFLRTARWMTSSNLVGPPFPRLYWPL